MKFDCGRNETWAEKKSRLSKWHRHFAIFPVRVGYRDCRWLETVERRGEFSSSYGDCGWNWEYRSIDNG